MALNTYDDQVSAVKDWLNRNSQAAVATRAPDFIELAQRRITREVRIPPMEVSTTLTVDANGNAAVPTDYLETKYMVASDSHSAWPVSPSTLPEVLDRQLNANATKPVVFDVEAAQFYIGAIPNGETITLVYYKEIEFISSSVSTNWFSNYAPELILFAAIAEAALYLKDMEAYAVYDKKYLDCLELLKVQKTRGEHAGGPLKVRRART